MNVFCSRFLVWKFRINDNLNEHILNELDAEWQRKSCFLIVSWPCRVIAVKAIFAKQLVY